MRGSGRFLFTFFCDGYGHSCFNPLHCGAVVASPGAGGGRPPAAAQVSVPFIAGQWSLLAGALFRPPCGERFQSPSLRGSGRFSASLRNSISFCAFQSPSLRGSGRFFFISPNIVYLRNCFNPLHCGAVVASALNPERARRLEQVSIPFIAGQWSLQGSGGAGPRRKSWFQSPSLRGSGRFGARRRRGAPGPPRFQSPSLRGSGRFRRRRRC